MILFEQIDLDLRGVAAFVNKLVLRAFIICS